MRKLHTENIADLRFFVFLRVCTHLTFLVDTNHTVFSLVYQEFKMFEISRLSVIVSEISAFTFYYF